MSARFYEQTNIVVNYNIVSWADAIAKWNLASIGGEAPDAALVFYTGPNILSGRQGNYGPMNLNDYVIEKYGSIDAFKEQFVPGAVDSLYASPFGYVAGIPILGSAQFMLIRDDLFKEAGITDEEGNAKAPTDYAELLEAAKKLTIDKDNDGEIDQYGISIGSGSGQGCWRYAD